MGSAIPVAMRMITVHAVAHKNKRTASELARIGRRQQITEPSHRLNDIHAELLADAPDEDLNRIRIAIKILIVEMFDQFGARHDPTGVMHEIGQQPVFVRGKLHRIAVDRNPAGAGIEPDRPAGELLLACPAERRSSARTRASTSSR